MANLASGLRRGMTPRVGLSKNLGVPRLAADGPIDRSFGGKDAVYTRLPSPQEAAGWIGMEWDPNGQPGQMLRPAGPRYGGAVQPLGIGGSGSISPLGINGDGGGMVPASNMIRNLSASTAVPQGAIPRSSSDTYLLNKRRGVVAPEPAGHMGIPPADPFVPVPPQPMPPAPVAAPPRVYSPPAVNPNQYPQPLGGPTYDRRPSEIFPTQASLAIQGFNRAAGLAEARTLPGPWNQNREIQDRNGYQYDANFEQAMRERGSRNGMVGAPRFGTGGPEGQGYTADETIAMAGGTPQAVDARYAVNPQGRNAIGGQYMLPPARSGLPIRGWRQGVDPANLNPPIDTPAGMPKIGADRQATLPNGQQVVMLPGRTIPTLVPRGRMVVYSEDGTPSISGPSTGGLVNAEPDPNYARHPGVQGRSVATRPQLSPEQLAENRALYKARQEERAAQSKALKALSRMQRGGRSGGAAKALAAMSRVGQPSVSATPQVDIDATLESLYGGGSDPAAVVSSLRKQGFSPAEIQAAIERRRSRTQVVQPTTVIGEQQGGGFFLPGGF